ncbi:MAG: hypothetical protein H6741_12930 [Alphaproteobacteria bacterium]|nr:hypothetical protein [Alphaproteobacteria bacterium]MCB9793620.1 hypothetical protein [Alphaproteobacteria bacterium]
MHLFGPLPASLRAELMEFLAATEGLLVQRSGRARSGTPFPKSTDLELALLPQLQGMGFEHHVRLQHPRTGEGFEYDFWRPADGLAIEVMGYRADDEVYKDILKFHVHQGTRVGIVLVPRWKWISGRRTETNHRATLKALAFADSYMDVDALVAISYDWEELGEGWRLIYLGLEAPGS